MFRLLIMVVVLISVLSRAGVVRAYDVSIEKVLVPYDVVTLDGSPEQERIILGELNNAPEMYEVKSDDDFTLTVEIRAVPGSVTSPQFSGIIVRQKEERGVEEVARMKASDASWAPIADKTTGLIYQSGPFFSEKVKAGTYHIEVSTPDNAGKYILVVGNKPAAMGYFDTLGAIGVAYGFYGLSTIHMFSSPYIHYPIGIVVVLVLLATTWNWQRRRTRHA